MFFLTLEATGAPGGPFLEGSFFFENSLLQFVLDRWWPHVVAMPCVLQLMVISGADGVSFGAQNVKCVIWHVCCAHSGTLRDHRAIQGHFGAQEGRRWDPGMDFYRFRMYLGNTF